MSLLFSIVALETFLWRSRARKVFRMTVEQSDATAVMAANQGVYNMFLTAGLMWGLYVGGAEGSSILQFFLGLVVCAGIVGGLTSSIKILYVQGLPALVAFVCVQMADSKADLERIGVLGAAAALSTVVGGFVARRESAHKKNKQQTAKSS